MPSPPRPCSRYSPTRVRYPYVRGVLLELYREAKAAVGGDPVVAWAAIQQDPVARAAYTAVWG